MSEKATLDVSDATFEQAVLKAPGPVVVDFWAQWCGPCRAIAPALEEIAQNFKGRLTIAKVDIDKNTEKAGEFEILSIPTLILFNQGQIVSKKIGASSKQDLLAWIRESLPL